jgi:hypothetical protein
VIKDAVLHLLNEQPLLADLPAEPQPGDLVLVCTNLRTTNRKRPHFVDDPASTFVFPYSQVRFVEMPSATRQAVRGPGGQLVPTATAEPDLELDEDLLRRVRDV